MAEALSNSVLGLSEPPLSVNSQGSVSSLPLPVNVPPNVRGDELFLSAIGGPTPTELDPGTVFFKGENGANDADDTDIYRGERPPSPIPFILEEDGASVASSSSSSLLNVGRRLGAIANVVEAAITRWARSHSSASSSSSSSSSSTTRTHTTRRRKGRRYSSTASIHNAAHERALLERKKAQEEFRIVPREFTLLLPSDVASGVGRPPQMESMSSQTSDQERERRTIRTSSMPLILAQLDSALKKSAKSRKVQERSAASDAPMTRIMNKWKGKKAAINEGPPGPKAQVASNSKPSGKPVPPRSWWLDVASPSWDDLRSIGKLLHLHPLTLEDILHRDPREKLELFPGLGYYFIVFRALEGVHSRERFRRFKTQDSEGAASVPSSSGDEGVIGAVNVYLVVFSEGICSFHFEDISEHTEKLRNKVLQMENSFHMTSDWIAHGLMDSIVDSFFPVLVSIEKEVKHVDTLVLESSTRHDTTEPVVVENASVPPIDGGSSTANSSTEKRSSEQYNSMLDEKGITGKERTALPLSIRISESPFIRLRHIRSLIYNLLWKRSIKKAVEKQQVVSSTSKTLLRIAATRRIVTSLGRLLGTKGEVIAQIRKRLIIVSVEASNAGLGLDHLDDGEVAIYMGDIQDHIITLQQSLNHYERMLSHSHPAYLSQLRVSQSVAKGGSDKAILLLTVVSMVVVSIQVLLGVFSINVGRIISNDKVDKGHPYNVFFAILSLSVLIGIGVVCLVRYWYYRAGRKFSRKI